MHPAAQPALSITALPAFESNYLWLLHRQSAAWVVDPGDAAVVLAALAAHQLTLHGILVTHHHADHTGGIAALRQAYPEARVIGPLDLGSPPIAGITLGAQAGESYALAGLGLSVRCHAVPGHTLDHLAYELPACEASAGIPRLFCGDALFAAGCGRLFEGTPGQMHASLQRLAALPAQTLVYCAHEYTLSNLLFAAAVEPRNAAIADRLARTQALRAAGQATVPFELGPERLSNPFLRCRDPAVQACASERALQSVTDEVAVFAELRAWKNVF